MSDVQKITAPQVTEMDNQISLTSVDKLVQLPVVEQTLGAASSWYGKIKDYNPMLKWTLDTAESTMSKAMETAKPVTVCLERPIKAVDSLLYSGLEYVENKVPAVKLPPQVMIQNTQNYVCETIQPAVQCAAAVKDYGTQKLADLHIIGHKDNQDSSAATENTQSTTDEKPKNSGVVECSDCQAQAQAKAKSDTFIQKERSSHSDS